MKILLNLLLSLAIASSILIPATAQNLPSAEVQQLGKLTQQQTDDNGGSFECGIASVFGQTPDLFFLNIGPSLLLPGDNGYMIVDNFSNINSAVSGITFWGVFQSEGFCTPQQPVQFRISFFEGSYMDNPLYQYDLSLTGELISYAMIPYYRFEANFPGPAELPSEGLISIQYIVDPFQPPCFFYWVSSAQGDFSSTLLLIESGNITMANPLPFDWSFCINEAPVVPLTNWAVMIGILLIITTLIIRFRKFQS